MAQTPPNQIPDTTETERWVMRTTLKERYRRDIEFQFGDADVRISPTDRDLAACPVSAGQSDGGCNFAVINAGACRCQFFDKPDRQRI